VRHQEPSVSWDEARELAHKTGQDNRARPASMDLAHCAGLTLAHDVAAEFAVPHYASSAMDGWAIAGAPPWELALPGTALSPGQATPVVTGGLIPAGTEAVLRSEYGEMESVAEQTLLHRLQDVPATEPPPGRHIRPAGEEAVAGERIIAAGTKLTPAHIAIAAVCGHDQLPVYPRPSAALLLTGDEVVTSGVPAPGQVRDTFGPTLPAIIHVLGGQASSSRRLPDDFEATRRAILECGGDVVVTTGGTGHSRADHLRRVLAELQAEVLAPSIRMRPGHPALMARLADGVIVVPPEGAAVGQELRTLPLPW
jgi:molybdopterin molybdotransferase